MENFTIRFTFFSLEKRAIAQTQESSLIQISVHLTSLIHEFQNWSGPRPTHDVHNFSSYLNHPSSSSSNKPDLFLSLSLFSCSVVAPFFSKGMDGLDCSSELNSN